MMSKVIFSIVPPTANQKLMPKTDTEDRNLPDQFIVLGAPWTTSGSPGPFDKKHHLG